MLEAFHLPAEPGYRLCLLHRPAGAPRRAVVYVHPFAEEMNKARRMAALQARRLATQGCAVLLIDLHGCGDSSGEFGEARWESWRRDVRAAVAHVAAQFRVPVSLWGLRVGAGLAADAARDSAEVDHLLLWQPVANGSPFLQQFLRLRVAGEMLASGAASGATSALADRLAAGEPLEIAGYDLHPDLARALERLKLEALAPAVKRVDWLEVAADPDAQLRPASRRVVEAWRSRGIEVHARQVAGEPFWTTVEIVECEALLARTSEALEALR